MVSLVGGTLGAYRIEAIIGHGATGDVYLGAHLYRAQHAAIKVLQLANAADPAFPTRFHATFEGVAALRHPHIIHLLEFGEEDSTCFIVMEPVTAGSLKTLMQQQPPGQPLPILLTVSLGCQAAEGLAHAHARGVVHKDIKPSNLLLDHLDVHADDTGAYTLKVTDFGLAQLAESSSELTTTGVLLGSGLMLGSPTYMPPELCRGRPLDARSDIYALGVVLYEMATGYPPFHITSLRDALREHVFTPPPLPHLFNPELPAALEEVILRCLAKRPEDRFDTASELAGALRVVIPAMGAS